MDRTILEYLASSDPDVIAIGVELSMQTDNPLDYYEETKESDYSGTAYIGLMVAIRDSKKWEMAGEDKDLLPTYKLVRNGTEEG